MEEEETKAGGKKGGIEFKKIIVATR